MNRRSEVRGQKTEIGDQRSGTTPLAWQVRGTGARRPTLTLEERYELIRQADARAMQRIINGDY
jgi:hypothetical protein